MRYIVALVFCVFMGMTGCSLGVGAALPDINLVAKPFVCPDGQMEASVSSRKGTGRNRNATYTSASWTCEDSKGKAEEISNFTIAMISGPFYGILMFLPLLLLMAMAKKGRAARAARGMPGPGMGQGPGMGPGYGQGPGYGPGPGQGYGQGPGHGPGPGQGYGQGPGQGPPRTF